MIFIYIFDLFYYRAQYKSYLHLYKKHLIEGYNSELEADLLKIEDTLNLTNIVLARMHAKIKVCFFISEREGIRELKIDYIAKLILRC